MRYVITICAICLIHTSYISTKSQLKDIEKNIKNTFSSLQEHVAKDILLQNNIEKIEIFGRIENIKDVEKNIPFYDDFKQSQQAVTQTIQQVDIQQSQSSLCQDSILHPVLLILVESLEIERDATQSETPFIRKIMQNGLFEQFIKEYLPQARNVTHTLLEEIKTSKPLLLNEMTCVGQALMLGIDMANNGLQELNLSIADENVLQEELYTFWKSFVTHFSKSVWHGSNDGPLPRLFYIIQNYNNGEYLEPFAASLIHAILDSFPSASQKETTRYLARMLTFEAYTKNISQENNLQDRVQTHLKNLQTLINLLGETQELALTTMTEPPESLIVKSFVSLEKTPGINIENIQPHAYGILDTLKKHNFLRQDKIEERKNESKIIAQYYEDHFAPQIDPDTIQQHLEDLYYTLDFVYRSMPHTI